MANIVRTYHLCPTFDIAPPPTGAIDLGSIVVSKLKLRAPLNRTSQVLIPEQLLDQRNEQSNTKHVVKNSSNSKFGLFTTIAQITGLGAEASVRFDKDANAEYSFEKELTTSFEPTDEYIEEAVASPGVKKFWEMQGLKTPVFMVTGLKAVEGATMRSSSNSSKGGKAGVGADLTTIGAPVTVAMKAERMSTAEESHDVGGSTPFIFCVRLKKIWWNKKKGVQSDDYNKAAFLDQDLRPQEDPAGQADELLSSDVNAGEFDGSELATIMSDYGEEWQCVYSVT